jgi:hypothetical protein
MTKMQCKFCDKQIDYIKEEKVAYEEDGSKHVCPGLNKPKKDWKKNWESKEAKGQNLEFLALVNDVKVIQEQFESFKETLGEHEKIIQGLVKATAFETGSGKKLRNPEDVQK